MNFNDWFSMMPKDATRPLTLREAFEARIDELMLEFCPDEMTPEQIANWQAHQTVMEEVK